MNFIKLIPLVFAVSMPSSAFATTNPEVIDLSVGESHRVTLSTGKMKTITLLSYIEHTEPYYEPANNSFVDAVVSADVRIEVEGTAAAISGGPFRLPSTVNGLAILVTTTRGWVGGIFSDNLKKDVRLEVKDASTPWYEPGRFVFPIRNYRWRIMNYQHTWLAVVVNQARLYYHRGEDMGMIPDLEAVLSMTSGAITHVPGPAGDGESNSVIIDDENGLRFHYEHMNAPNIRPDLQPHSRVKQGEKIGLTGDTWQGKPVPGPHLHVDITEKGTYRNSFPIFVAAYLRSYPGSVLPIAGGWRHVWAGEELELDGSLSIASLGRKISSYNWVFSDGTRAAGSKVRRRYVTPGTYSEQLLVRDSERVADSDFVEVFVLDRKAKSRPPYALINYYPVRGIKPLTEVNFLTRYNNMKDVTIDFGDGTRVPYAEEIKHRYQKPGLYVVAVTGKDSGSGPGVFKVRVVVE